LYNVLETLWVLTRIVLQIGDLTHMQGHTGKNIYSDSSLISYLYNIFYSVHKLSPFLLKGSAFQDVEIAIFVSINLVYN